MDVCLQRRRWACLPCAMCVLTASLPWPAGIETVEAIERLAEMCPSLQASADALMH